MCIACEMGFWNMVDALPPEARERIMREQAARQNDAFACDAPDSEPPPAIPASEESKPNREKP